MKVRKMTEVVVLSALKDGVKSRIEIEARTGLEKKIAKDSLSALKRSGLVYHHKISGSELYSITYRGRNEIESMFRNMGKL